MLLLHRITSPNADGFEAQSGFHRLFWSIHPPNQVELGIIGLLGDPVPAGLFPWPNG